MDSEFSPETIEPATESDDQETRAPSAEASSADTGSEQPRSRDTRPLPAVDVEPGQPEHAAALPAEGLSEDETATVVQDAMRPVSSSRPRKTTLSVAIRKQSQPGRPGTTDPGTTRPPERQSQPPSAAPVQPLPDGIADEVDEWAVADQPTVYLAPNSRPTGAPEYMRPGPGAARPKPVANVPDVAPGYRDQGMPPRGGDAFVPPWAPPRYAGMQRLAAPDGRMAEHGTGAPDPRMARFQELRRHRLAHDRGALADGDARPVADVARQWWSDLRPGLERALRYQHEARESGIHPIPATEPVPSTRLGDAFGQLAASARELTGRAQAKAGPVLKKLHAQAEQAAQAFVDRFEGGSERQQEPFLGPGRIAVFFRQGVSVGQAQRLLAASRARPIRLIPRKHGLLALVPPGSESEIGERLRLHPYVRDVNYVEYDADMQPMEQR